MDAVKSLKSSSSRIINLNIPIPTIFSKSFSSLSSPRTPTCKSPANSISPPRRSSGSGGREAEFREVFKRFDTDNDGRISAYEIRAYFGSVGEQMSHEDAEAAIAALDGDGDGLIDFQDFLKLMEREDGEEDGDLKAAFEMFELGKGSGRITPKSLQKVLNWLGEPKSYDECVTMIKVYDIDGNGELDFHEFRQMMAA